MIVYTPSPFLHVLGIYKWLGCKRMDPRKRLPVLLLVQLGVCALLIVTVSQFVVKTDKIKHVQNPIPLNDTTFAAEKRQLDTSLEVKHFIEQTPKSSNGVIIQPDVPISDAKKIIDYKTELLIDYETEMMKLNKAKVAQDDPWLIKLIRDYYIEPPSSLPYNLTYPDRTDYSKGQAPFVDSRLNYLVSAIGFSTLYTLNKNKVTKVLQFSSYSVHKTDTVF